MMPDDDHSPISALDAKHLFADWKAAPAIVLAISGGPDSVALMWLPPRGAPRPAPASAREAPDVKGLARSLDLPHRTVRWTGAKPNTGLPAAAREARYRLLA